MYFADGLFGAVARRVSPECENVFQFSFHNFIKNLVDILTAVADTGQMGKCFRLQFIFDVLRKLKGFAVSGAACSVSNADKIGFKHMERVRRLKHGGEG